MKPKKREAKRQRRELETKAETIGLCFEFLKNGFLKIVGNFAAGIFDGIFADGCLVREGSVVRLTRHGVMLSDMVFRDLFIVE